MPPAHASTPPLRGAQTARPRHLPEIDILRGVAILLVLYLHSYFSTWPEVTETERLWVALSHLLAHGAVPCFLFISGFLLGRDRSGSFSTFAAGRLRRIAVPGLTWMFLALTYESWRAGGLTGDLLRRFVMFDIQGQFYFLFVLGVLTAAAYPLRSASARTLGLATVLAFLAGLVVIGWYEQRPITGDLAILAYRNPLIWAFFFLFGLLAQRRQGAIAWSRRVEVGAAIGMMGTVGAYLWQGSNGGYPTSYFGITVYLTSAMGLVVYPALVRAVARDPVGRVMLLPFGALAPFAFGVFLVHKPYFLGWFSSETLTGTRFAESWGLLMLANFALGAVGSIVFVVLSDRLFRRLASTFLGVEHRRRARQIPPEPERREAA